MFSKLVCVIGSEVMITFEDSFQGTPLNCMIKNLILGKFEE